jgi:ATP-binding cassette subfamily B protein
MRTHPLSAIGIVLRLSWKTDRSRLVIGAALVLIGTLGQPGIALLSRSLTNEIIDAGQQNKIAFLAAAITFCLLAQLLFVHFGHLWYFELGEINEIELNLLVARSIHRGQPLDVVERPDVADGIDLARGDVARIRGTVAATIALAAIVVQLAFTLILLTSVSPWLLLLPAAAVVPVLITSRAEAPLQRAREITAVELRRARQAREAMTLADQAKETRLGTARQRLTTIHDDAQSALTRGLRRGHLGQVWRRCLGQLPLAIATVAAIAYTCALATQGDVSAGDVVMVLTISSQISGQIVIGVTHLATVSAASTGLGRVRDLAAGTPTTQQDPREPPETIDDELSISGLSYRYPDEDHFALRDLDLRIPRGSTVALVGENGAGKSTLIKLVQGLYQPTSGQITIDQREVSEYDQQSWLGRTSALFQDFAHFDFSAGECIGIGDIEHIEDSDAVQAAVRRAGIEDLVTSFGGLATVLGKGYRDGRELSGGQWQAVGLARALMKRSPLILTLDEPGHSLDPEAEVAMVEAYEVVARDYAHRTGAIVFYVTHRLSSVRSADLVVVLRDGAIEAVGSHDELMRQAGYYYDLFTLQAAAYCHSRGQ